MATYTKTFNYRGHQFQIDVELGEPIIAKITHHPTQSYVNAVEITDGTLKERIALLTKYAENWVDSKIHNGKTLDELILENMGFIKF